MRLQEGHLLKRQNTDIHGWWKVQGGSGRGKDEMAKPDVSNRPLTTQFISNVLLTIT